MSLFTHFPYRGENHVRQQYVFYVVVNGQSYREFTVADNPEDAKLNVMERVAKYYNVFHTDIIEYVQIHPSK